MKPRIALFQHHPECSIECCDGMTTALGTAYDVRLFGVYDDIKQVLAEADIVAFPGGIGDANTYHRFFRRRNVDQIVNFVHNGGKYLGICMGAYWAGRYYFDLLEHGVDAVQYIKRPDAEVKRPYSTITEITWNGVQYDMFFYDGCAFTGDHTKFKTVASYANGDAMAIIQGNMGLIGCHPESTELFFQESYLKPYWHQGQHHVLLKEFVDQLIK